MNSIYRCGALCVLAMVAPLAAQVPSGSTFLPPDDPMLYAAFFAFEADLGQMLEQKRAIDPQNGPRNERWMAKTLRVQQTELGVVHEISWRLVGELADWQEQLKVYVEKARADGGTVDPKAMNQFDQLRRGLIESAVQTLAAKLSPGSWEGIRKYVNDEHRMHTKVLRYRDSQ